MTTIFVVLILACVIIAAVSFFFSPIGIVLGFVFIIGILAYLINKLMCIEDKLDQLLEDKDSTEK